MYVGDWATEVALALTHLHIDHDGGLSHFPSSRILVPRGELEIAKGWPGRLRGYMPNRWPSWFDPVPLDLEAERFDPFGASKRLTEAGDVVAVATPGHTAHHLSVLVQDEDAAILLAGDASYTEDLMLAGKIDGVSPNAGMSRATLAAIREFAGKQRTIYLSTHDPDSATRLAEKKFVAAL